MGKKTRRSFTKEYKAEVVGLIRHSGKTVGAVCRDLGLTETAVRRWVQQAEVDSGRGPAGALTTEEREEFAQLSLPRFRRHTRSHESAVRSPYGTGTASTLKLVPTTVMVEEP